MVEQYLSNKNESATVSEILKFHKNIQTSEGDNHLELPMHVPKHNTCHKQID